jgi:hypothetical protein
MYVGDLVGYDGKYCIHNHQIDLHLKVRVVIGLGPRIVLHIIPYYLTCSYGIITN